MRIIIKEDIPELSKILALMKDDMLKEKNIYDSIVTAIINRASDRTAKAFDNETKEIISNYLSANAKNADEKRKVVTNLWNDANIILLENRTNKAWCDDAKKELYDLADGKVRDQSNGLKR